METIQHYTLGLVFDDQLLNVLLIRKNRPAWQAGKLNGVGGKLEAGETPLEGMVREFQEETGLATAASQWRPFGRLEADHAMIHCFKMRTPRIHDARSTTDEHLEIVPIDLGLLRREGQSNLATLVANAIDPDGPFLLLRYRGLARADLDMYSNPAA